MQRQRIRLTRSTFLDSRLRVVSQKLLKVVFAPVLCLFVTDIARDQSKMADSAQSERHVVQNHTSNDHSRDRISPVLVPSLNDIYSRTLPSSDDPDVSIANRCLQSIVSRANADQDVTCCHPSSGRASSEILDADQRVSLLPNVISESKPISLRLYHRNLGSFFS